MSFKRGFSRLRLNTRLNRNRQKTGGLFTVFVILACLILAYLLIYCPVRDFLKEISGQIALSDATDMITEAVNRVIGEKMREGQYDYDYFVTLEKDGEGRITAISANMARINALSSDILQTVIDVTNSGELDLEIPLGNLLNSNLLLGRGPEVPVKIIMLTSSYADFRNELSDAGINQTRHQIILEVQVDIDVLMPWEVQSTHVRSEVIIAETIIVGSVPDTYLELRP